MRSLILFLVLSSFLFAQQMVGGYGKKGDSPIQIVHHAVKITGLAVSQQDFQYTLAGYSFGDVVVFSYFDNSKFVAYDNAGTAVDSVVLNRDEFYTFSLTPGAFHIDCNNSFTALTGDPITRSVMGYFAVDESGSPLSTHMNTFMPKYEWGGERFVVFAYEDGTEVQVKNLTDTTTAAATLLNRGEHLELTNVTNTFLGVRASKPISALSYADQGYYIPSDNGTFAGTTFFGFSGYIGSWANGVIVTAYHDETIFIIYNSQTGDTLLTDTLNYGETGSISVSEDLYWEVQSNKKVTVCNTPYASWSGSYYYMTRQMDYDGKGIGTHFLAPCIPGDFVVNSYENNNQIQIVNLSNLDTVNVTLQKGENYSFYSYKAVYQVISTENISIFTSYGGSFGADFAPLNYSLLLPDLAISSIDIDFDPDTISNVVGTPFTINAKVHNYGYVTAYDVQVQFFDGSPTANNAISPVFVIDSIPSGQTKMVSTNWETPTYAAYHSVFVVVDQQNLIVESSESNNSASKNLIPNEDLLPPLATVVNAPRSVTYNGDSLSFEDFVIEVEVYNSGDVDATNVTATLHLPTELSIAVGADSLHAFGNVPANTTVKHFWNVHINAFPDSSEDAYFYSITVDADNAEGKEVKRALLFEDSTTVSIEEAKKLAPKGFLLSQNYPNPFNPTTQINYELPKAGQVEIAVFDLNGRLIQSLTNQFTNSGRHKVEFNGSNLSSGLYFVRLKFNGQDIASIKMTLIK
ncbi:MAG: T9SS type A sorting domain-containing protein [Caldisericaceae bacterium]|nr:T9SS type A sorting domain-containing protein [Caldisericaceae bacterium]